MNNPFGWSYPAGAENDPNAPYNQPDLPEACEVCGEAFADDDDMVIDDDMVCCRACAGEERCPSCGEWFSSPLIDGADSLCDESMGSDNASASTGACV